MAKLLDKIFTPYNIKELSIEQLEKLASEIRQFIIDSVSETGGHLASNLGVVELTLAMHYVFDFKSDKLLWDVGHQCYTHKIITGRKDGFVKLRKDGGISGFPEPDESEYDQFEVGHAGTGIPTALGMALGAQVKGTNENVVAFVGDASIVNGMSFEALNNFSLLKRQMLVILNDNSMAIDVTRGSFASFLSKVRLSHTFEDIVKNSNNILEHVPLIGKKVEGALDRFKKNVKMSVSANPLFDSMNIGHYGPVDGHNIKSLIELFKALKGHNRPAILHVYTQKGKGFLPAEDNPTKYHGSAPFFTDGKQVTPKSAKNGTNYTQVFGDKITDMASKDSRIMTITAAMPDGTGLVKFKEKFPERYLDVGIAESVAVDIAAGLAKTGMKPFVCIYSTFLQRSFDQIAHEVSLQGLPVVFCIDRAGVVGDDGPTHHGLMDIGFIRALPGIEVVAPATATELELVLEYALVCEKPIAIRYPRSNVMDRTAEPKVCLEPFDSGKGVFVSNQDSDIVLVNYGAMLENAMLAADNLRKEDIAVDIYNARFVAPLDEEIVKLWANGKTIVTLEDHAKSGGFGSALLEAVSEYEKHQLEKGANLDNAGKVILLAASHDYIEKNSRENQLDQMGLSPDKIADTVRKVHAKVNTSAGS